MIATGHSGVDRLLTRDFAYIVAAHTFSAMGWSSMLLLPLYLSHVGASRSEIGAIMASAAVGGLLVRPAVGALLDRWGRRQVIALGSALQVVGMVGIALVQRPDEVPYVARLVFGVGSAAVFTGYFTLATDLVPVARRTEGIALFGISGLVPLVINPGAQALGVDAPALRLFLPATAALVLLSLLPLARIRERPRPRSQRASAAAVLRALSRRPLWSAWAVTIAFAGLVVVFQSFGAVTAKARGLPRPADLWLTYAIGAVAIRAFGARLPDRVGTRNLIAPSVALLVAGVLSLAAAQSQTAVLIAGLCGGLGHGIGFPVLTSQIATRSSVDVRGSALAAFTGLWDCAFLSVPPLLGLIADARGDALMLASAAAVAVAGLALWALLEWRYGSDVPPGAFDGGDGDKAVAAAATVAAVTPSTPGLAPHRPPPPQPVSRRPA